MSELHRIETSVVRALPEARSRPTGFMGRLLGRGAGPTAQDRRLDLEASPALPQRAGAIMAHRLLAAPPRDVARQLPEALLQGPPSKDDEHRFLDLAEAAAAIVDQHMRRPLPNVPSDEQEVMRVQALVSALEDDPDDSLAERLSRSMNAALERRSYSGEIAQEDALLVEVDNVILGDVESDGTMAYCMDVVVEGHPLATVASRGDGALEVLSWLGGHGQADLDALRDHVALYGEPRSDENGDRPDSLEEMLIDRVTVLLARRAFLDILAESVLFCDPEADAPGGYVVKVVTVDPEVGREATWGIVVEEFPESVILDMLDEDDAFTLWMAYS